MADTIKSTSTFEVGLEFEDGNDTQKTTVKIPNYKANITKEGIIDAFTGNGGLGFYDSNNQYHGLNSEMFVTGSTVNETVRIIDISGE